MTPQVQNELMSLAAQRVRDALGSVAQLTDTHEETAKIYIAVLTVLSEDLCKHMRETLIHGHMLPDDLLRLRVFTMLAKALSIDAIPVTEEQARAAKNLKP